MIISLSSITLFCFYLNAWFAVSGYFDEDYTQGIFNGIAAIICYVSNRFLKRYEEMIDGEDEEWQVIWYSMGWIVVITWSNDCLPEHCYQGKPSEQDRGTIGVQPTERR